MLTPQEHRDKKQAEFAKSHNTEAIDKHWEKVHSHQITIEDALRKSAPPKTERRQVISFEKARDLVINIIAESFPPVKENTRTSFKTDEKTKAILTKMTKYFINDPSSELDLNKGILLYGNVGTGKTTLFRIFKRLSGALDILDNYEKKFTIVKTSSIVLEVREKENEGSIKQYFSGGLCFDDLGKEPKEVKIYGNSSTVMGDILFNRYDRMCLTHGTTNLNEQELKDHYGDRIHSRMMEMFNWILVDGIDYRKI